MLERRGHGGDMALWMEQGCGAAVAVVPAVTPGSRAAAPRPGWAVLRVVSGVLILSPTFCCAKGNPHNPEGKLLRK